MLFVTLLLPGLYQTVAAKCSQEDIENGSCSLPSSQPWAQRDAPLIAYDLASLVTALIVFVAIFGGASIMFYAKAMPRKVVSG
jgi:hypothetical protein